MSENQLEDIRCFLRFDNSSTRCSRLLGDKFSAVRLLIDEIVKNLKMCYNHNNSVTLDEQLYPFRDRYRYITVCAIETCKIWLKILVISGLLIIICLKY